MEPAGPKLQGTHDTPPTFEEFCDMLRNEYAREQEANRKIEFDIVDIENLRNVFSTYYLVDEAIGKILAGEYDLPTFFEAIAPLRELKNHLGDEKAKRLLTSEEQTAYGFYQYLLNKTYAISQERERYDILKDKERKALETYMNAKRVDAIDVSLEGVEELFLYTPMEHGLIGSSGIPGAGFHPNVPLGLFSTYMTQELASPENAELGLENLTLEGINALRQGRTIKMNYQGQDGEEYRITLALLPISADDSAREKAGMSFSVGEVYSLRRSEIVTPPPFNAVQAVREKMEQLQQKARRT